jgi:small-conductance mechanosensitive channel
VICAPLHRNFWRAASLLLFVFLNLISLQVQAQENANIAGLPREWLETAAKAERLLQLPATQRNRIAADDWEELRLDLTVQRELARKQAAQGSLRGRIIAAQLASMPDRPTSKSGPPWVSVRRARLEADLAAQDAPAANARDFQAQASVLIADLDEAQRQQRRRELFAHGYSVFSSATWSDARTAIGKVRQLPAISPPAAALHLAAAGVAGLLALAAAYVVRRRARRAIAARSLALQSPKARLGLAFLRDFVDIAAPGLAMVVLYTAMRSAAAEIPVLSAVSGAIMTAGIAVIYGRWLGHSLFAPAFPAARLIMLPEHETHAAIRLMALLGGVLAADSFHERLVALPGHSAAADAIASSAIVVCGGVCTWLLARILKQGRGVDARPVVSAEGETRGMAIELLRPVANVMMAVAIITPLASFVGFVNFASNVLTAMLWSLALAATALFLYRSLTEGAALLFIDGRRAQSRYMQLLPLLFGFLLAILTLPLIAVACGVNPEMLVDGLLALKNGVAVGEIRVSFGSVMTFGLMFLLGYALTRWLQRILHYTVLDRLRVDAGARAAILTGVGYIGLTLSALVAITAAGLNLSSLAVIAGALSVGIGFGLQSVVANFVSGIILLIERPIKEGDWIEVAGYSGHVRKVAFRSTHIETFDRHEVIIPNTELVSGSVTNLTYGGSEGWIVLPVSVAYGSDLEAARTLLLEVAAAHAQVLSDPPPRVVLEKLGDSAVDFNLMCFVENVNQRLTVRSDLNFSIVRALADAGITIPFPQREVWLRDQPDRPNDRFQRRPL